MKRLEKVDIKTATDTESRTMAQYKTRQVREVNINTLTYKSPKSVHEAMGAATMGGGEKHKYK